MRTMKELEDADMDDHPTGWAFVWAILNLIVVGIVTVIGIGYLWLVHNYLTK